MSDCNPDFADSTTYSCVSDCPNGYTENGNSCSQFEFCHSTCATCSEKADSTKCLTCPSSLNWVYNVFFVGQTASTCSINSNNNAQFLMTVDKDTTLGSGTPGLVSVTYNWNT